MILQIPGILTDDECAALCDNLNRQNIWQDGKATAAGAARAVKNNQQADPSNGFVTKALQKVEGSLLSNAVFNAAAQPDRFARTLFSRYQADMAYGAHVDAAYINDIRTDISITVFLNAPESYDGGELLIMAQGHDDEIKPTAGTAVVYPSTSLHEVRPVTKGERIAFVGWVRSRVRSIEHRSVLFDLDRALIHLRTGTPDNTAISTLSNVRNNLLRIFGD